MTLREKAQEILDKTNAFCDNRINSNFPIRGYDFTHIVLGDFNFSHSNVYWCLTNEVFTPWLLDQLKSGEYHDKEMNDAVNFIEEVNNRIQFMWMLLSDYSDEELRAAQSLYLGDFDDDFPDC